MTSNKNNDIDDYKDQIEGVPNTSETKYVHEPGKYYPYRNDLPLENENYNHYSSYQNIPGIDLRLPSIDGNTLTQQIYPYPLAQPTYVYPSYAQPVNYHLSNQSDYRSDLESKIHLKQTLLKEFFRKYEISPCFQEDTNSVSGYEIIIIADDSSSMRDPSDYLSIYNGRKVYGTRWTELQMVIEVIAEIGVILDDDGIDIWFLNRPEPVKNIRSAEEVKLLFHADPTGRTPLTSVLKKVMAQPTTKPKLILIATDGEPNDDDGYSDIDNFIKLLRERDYERNRISILACTTSKKTMAWLNDAEKNCKHKCKRVDVIDDYATEKDQILKIQGEDFSYTLGDHILKMLLGPIFQKYDDLDEKPLPGYSKNYTKKKKRETCMIL
jgi:hypothetical protein